MNLCDLCVFSLGLRVKALPKHRAHSVEDTECTKYENEQTNHAPICRTVTVHSKPDKRIMNDRN